MEGETWKEVQKATVEKGLLDLIQKVNTLTEENAKLREALKELFEDTCYRNHDGTAYFMWGRTGGTRLSKAALKAKELIESLLHLEQKSKPV